MRRSVHARTLATTLDHGGCFHDQARVGAPPKIRLFTRDAARELRTDRSGDRPCTPMSTDGPLPHQWRSPWYQVVMMPGRISDAATAYGGDHPYDPPCTRAIIEDPCPHLQAASDTSLTCHRMCITLRLLASIRAALSEDFVRARNSRRRMADRGA